MALDPADLGTDVGLLPPAVGPRMSLVGGRLNLAYALARRFATERGTLEYDLDYGENLLTLVNQSLSPAQIAAKQSAIVEQAEQDDRVQSASARLTTDTASRSIVIEIEIVDALGPFPLVLGVGDLGVTLLGGLTTPATAGGAPVLLVPSFAGPPGPAGPAGPPGPQGPAGGGGGGGQGGVALASTALAVSSTGAEDVLPAFAFTANLVTQPAGTITLDVALRVRSQTGNAVVRIYVGGTFGVADGTLVAQAIVGATGSGYTAIALVGTLANPVAIVPVKVTLQSSGPGVEAAVTELDGSIG